MLTALNIIFNIVKSIHGYYATFKHLNIFNGKLANGLFLGSVSITVIRKHPLPPIFAL